jgi:hypothetical protein
MLKAVCGTFLFVLSYCERKETTSFSEERKRKAAPLCHCSPQPRYYSSSIVSITMLRLEASIHGLVLFLATFCFLWLSGDASFLSRSSLENEAAIAATSAAQRNLLWQIDYTPGPDPDAVCKAFQDAAADASTPYQCDCELQEDQTSSLACLSMNKECNEGSSICYMTTINVGLNLENVIEEVETCTQYVDLNFTSVEGGSTQYANYSTIRPCVKVFPQAPGDFTKLSSCEVTMNGAACYKCEICTDEDPLLALSFDCCNTNPNQEQLKVTCGLAGGGGAFVPFFDTFEEGQMEECKASGAADIYRSTELALLSTLVVVVAVPAVSFFL